MIHALILSAALSAGAPTTQTSYLPDQLSGVALNATAATRTLDLTLRNKWAKLRVGVDYTNSAATTVTGVLSCSLVSGGTKYTFQTKACSSGTCSHYDRTDSNAVSGDEDFFFEFDIRGCWDASILFGGASADGSDVITTESVALTGQ